MNTARKSLFWLMVPLTGATVLPVWLRTRADITIVDIKKGMRRRGFPRPRPRRSPRSRRW
jgi:hypothetical protein